MPPFRIVKLLASIEALWMRLPFVVRTVPALAIMVVLWWSSSRLPTSDPPSLVRVLFHNSMHVVVYAALGAALFLGWRRGADGGFRCRAIGSWMLAAGYGVVDELHQRFVPGRVCSLADLVSDAAGAALAVALLLGIVGSPGRWQRVVVFSGFVATASVLLASFAGW